MIDEKKLIEDVKKHYKDMLMGCIIDGDTMWLSKEVCNIIESQPKVGEWVSVSERLPEKEQNVLAWRGGHIGGMMDVYCYMGKGVWEDSYGYFQDTYEEGITAWRELPEPYKGE